jgi:multiple sugar transport system substrate-binding protein
VRGELEGVSWGHTRGFVSVVATAQRFSELHPEVRIRWHSRTLHDFGHADVAELARRFDLIVIDHPWMGFAAHHACLLPVDEGVDAAEIEGWRRAGVGDSFDSYRWDDRLWAAPIDAASPAASVRREGGVDAVDAVDAGDAVGAAGAADAVDPPRSWDELLALAREGRVLLPCFPADLFLHLLMLLATRGAATFGDDAFAPADEALAAMETLRELVALVPRVCDAANPIAIYEMLAAGGHAAYCPFAYSYATYARRGYALHRLRFLDLPPSPEGIPLRGVLGGTGLAVSARCRDREAAFAYLAFTASERVQRGPYSQAGGQGAHAAAWGDAELDRLYGGFFTSTRPAIERAWTRPRWYGYPSFQERAGQPLLAWIRGGGRAAACLEELNALYRRARALPAP